jgi:hypothetical protein
MNIFLLNKKAIEEISMCAKKTGGARWLRLRNLLTKDGVIYLISISLTVSRFSPVIIAHR